MTRTRGRGSIRTGRVAPARLAAIALLALLVCCLGSGCGGAKGSGEATIVVASRGYDEDELLREIYAQSLEAAGFAVRRSDLPAGLLLKGLEEGRLSGYPDHLETAFAEVTQTEQWDAPSSTGLAYGEIEDPLAAKGLVALAPASFERSSAVAVPRKTAEGSHLSELSDLKEPARHMDVVEREVYCYGRGRCLNRLEQGYGVSFRSFRGVPFREQSSLPYEALRSGEADAAIVVDTEGRLARAGRWLALFEDDEDRLQASNPLWLTSQDVIEEAGPEYERAILAAQKHLTVEVMRRLNAEVELDGESPSKVAAGFLKSLG